ncbi:MAG: ferredoxin [Pseudomonadota bacterium]|uniref:ferredoxin n=1 Tax=Roseovarius TaxID=74030 RepID=UPI0022A6B953|nr:ferredoxin [Roseovarius sp. EGI FJ00037]MCZ0811479.1 ferredoxin [Roseovarius sp. EGI FJ00037]
MLQDIEKHAEKQHLAIFGGVSHDLPDGFKTLVLLGPLEPGFWGHFTGSPEYGDGRADPLDRWSERIIGELANTLNAKAFFPFGGPPFQPFLQWARASGRAHVSPVGPLVHDVAGLMVSYRGALGFAEAIELPDPPPNPCDTCENQPCLSACPVGALGPAPYDAAACRAHLEDPENICMSKGCLVRRACPVSQSHGRREEQSAFHMRAFK